MSERVATAYAHSTNGVTRHELVAHLRATARVASDFAASFGAPELAYCLGLWHDLGKFHPNWQRYLLASESDPALRGHGPDHKAAGAVHIVDRLASFGIVGLLIQGHHGGLRSFQADFRAWVDEKRNDAAVLEALEHARAAMPEIDSPPVINPPTFAQDRHEGELFLRMLFAALVDADYLDTEQHFSAGKTASRGSAAGLSALLDRFEGGRVALVTRPDPQTHYQQRVAEARQAIYQDCLSAADLPPGLFRLTVPTGGGKTLSGMAFALRHGKRHGLRRVVVAVPFITITGQTAQVYRDAFQSPRDNASVVLEHHSGAAGDPQDEASEDIWTQLAAENWDAPIVVTTTVQLFDSLFSNKPSHTRKLHRLAKSVIILDEAQALPAHLLTPILDALQQLVRHYGTTVVLSTATQPAFETIQAFRELDTIDIVPHPWQWFDRLRRVRYEFPAAPLDWPEVARLMRETSQVLAVVNTKKDAFALLDALGDASGMHLSTTLCGRHRRAVIDEVKRRLDEGEPCRLVSTQIVEAGVDLDFPVVLRAAGPLDGVIQAAGRCNREGRLGAEGGRVVVFRPAGGGMPTGTYRTGHDVGRAVLAGLAAEEQADTPDVLRRYFQQLFTSVETDRERVQEARGQLDYPEVARRFRMINDDTESIVITSYGTDSERRRVLRWIEELRAPGPNKRRLLRLLQPHTVAVRRHEAERYRQRRLIEDIMPGVGVWYGDYDSHRSQPYLGRGLTGDGPNPDMFVV